MSLTALLTGLAVLCLWGLGLRLHVAGPSPATRREIARVLALQGMELAGLSVTNKGPTVGRSSKAVLKVRTKDQLGLQHTRYFKVDAWEDMLSSKPRVEDLGTYVGALYPLE